jgi:hypothetical protein
VLRHAVGSWARERPAGGLDVLDDAALWRELRSFKGDWDRWSIGERLVAPVTALVSALSASVMLMNGL